MYNLLEHIQLQKEWERFIVRFKVKGWKSLVWLNCFKIRSLFEVGCWCHSFKGGNESGVSIMWCVSGLSSERASKRAPACVPELLATRWRRWRRESSVGMGVVRRVVQHANARAGDGISIHYSAHISRTSNSTVSPGCLPGTNKPRRPTERPAGPGFHSSAPCTKPSYQPITLLSDSPIVLDV